MKETDIQAEISENKDEILSPDIDAQNELEAKGRKAAAIASAGAGMLAAASGVGGAALKVASASAIAAGAGPIAFGTMAAGLLLTAFSKSYRSLPINKKTAAVGTVSDTWKNRPKANMVKWLMKQSGESLETVAAHLGCSVSYLNNKLTRDSFSFDDLILAAYACGYTFVLVDNNEEVDRPDSFRVDLMQYFEGSDPAALKRINKIEEDRQKARREEYEAKKAELERMKKEYGIED